MEFQFSLHTLFGEEVTLVDSSMTPYRNNPSVSLPHKKQLCEVIDKLGIASAKAQGLHGAITTSSKLKHSSDHHLYVMKEDMESGLGAAVGILKVGHKKLFMYDHHGAQHEMDPLCILDFYVHESRQRKGCGKKLFETMLKHEKVKPAHLAIDRPSPKFLSFLTKHYNLKATINQVNNFVVFEGFFRDRPVEPRRGRGGRSTMHYRSNSIERHSSRHVDPAVQKREENVRGSQSMTSLPLLTWNPEPETPRRKEALSNVPPRSSSRDSLSSGGSAGPQKGVNPATNQQAGLVAKQNMYSRHGVGDASANQKPEDINIPSSTQRGDNSSQSIQRNRDGPSEEFQNLSINSRSYQNSRGHLKVESNPEPSAQPVNPIYSRGGGHPRPINSSWNIFGVPPRQPTNDRQSTAQTRLY